MPSEIAGWDSEIGASQHSAAANSVRNRRRGSTITTEIHAWANFEEIGKSARNFQRRRASVVKAKVDNATIQQGIDPEEKFRRANEYVFDPTKQAKNESNHEEALTFITDPESSPEHKIFAVYFDEDMETGEDTHFYDSVVPNALINFLGKFNGTMSWLPFAIQENVPSKLGMVLNFLEYNLRSIGQVYFCNNPFTGLLFVVALLIQSTRCAVYGIVATITANGFALLMRFDRGLIASGLFGYNSILCGLAIGTFSSTAKHADYTVEMICSSIITSLLSVLFFVAMAKILNQYKSPPFTFPFNFAAIFFLLGSGSMLNIQGIQVIEPSLPSNGDLDQPLITVVNFFLGSLRSIGQVFLADNIISGGLMLIGIGICSRYLAVAAYLGSLIANGLAVLIGSNNGSIEAGLFGYNASLTLAAMALFYVPSLSTFVLGILAVIMTVLAQHTLIQAFAPFGLPVMTLPFCVISLAMILMQGTTDIIISVPLPSITIPEDHLKRVLILREGFHFLKRALSNQVKVESRKLINLGKSSKSMKRMEIALLNVNNEFISMSDVLSKGDELDLDALNIFREIDEGTGHISKQQFLDYLRRNSFNSSLGLKFAEQAFELMDFDGNGTLEMMEFISFVRISNNLSTVRNNIKSFFSFVDANDNFDIDIDELNDALNYLEEPALDTDEQNMLLDLSNGAECIDIVTIVNFATISALREMIEKFHKEKNKQSTSG
ncbi:hypothetical protein CTEN210_11735 [Chaetoceros tenuissimus]|uniref:EF-hand domain-containing protein n=1 Tax=Chaetoceros tenuissimus TaxID=426638 RepID=A0AAD3D361_9STRA|nr:hypothetical protein CTEN210_11735 [Chaetoceros tenuissimus]